MELTPEERVRVAEAIYETDEGERDEVAASWARVFVQRADEIESGAVVMLTRDEANQFLDARAAARDA